MSWRLGKQALSCALEDSLCVSSMFLTCRASQESLSIQFSESSVGRDAAGEWGDKSKRGSGVCMWAPWHVLPDTFTSKRTREIAKGWSCVWEVETGEMVYFWILYCVPLIYVCFYASTMLIWLLWPFSIIWCQVAYLPHCSSFLGLLRLLF